MVSQIAPSPVIKGTKECCFQYIKAFSEKKVLLPVLTCSIIFVSIVSCILSLTSLLLSPILVFASIATVGLCIICVILLLLLRDKLKQRSAKIELLSQPILPKNTPTTSLQRIVSIAKEAALIASEVKEKEQLFPNMQEWAAIFLKDPAFLLKCALNTWEYQDTPEGGILTSPRVDFDVILTLDSNAEIQQLKNEIDDSLKVTYLEQILATGITKGYAGSLLRRNEVEESSTLDREDFMVISSNMEILEQGSTQEEILYKVFRESFLLYYTALLQNLGTSLLVIQPLGRNSTNSTVQHIEWLALFAALEQAQYSNHILSPKEYWKHWVEKNCYSSLHAPFNLIRGHSTTDLAIEALMLSNMNMHPEFLNLIRNYSKQA
ncbi:hypothetical protein [Chlamydia pecorum]|uniref:Uncharacterized protein n=2 Tax=Chlamydia pecorum TaxID=85991 RepID=A0AA34WIG1_CHLPE|nr:hypothetical protein [Chlamydia pecorum]AEB41937.1 conserved hypothetical protein [Chlamydia pecorum E58]AGW39018.1 hypothetical protein CPE2_0613 [Chlamydia pecorum W73]UFP06553.1 hypothetical protein KY091_03775 [Chlamydia pecorum]UJT77275.1 hypothetical protein NSWBovSBE_0891 [Chlamydia pecorum]